MRYERSYFHDARQHTGRYPADEALGIHSYYSPQVKRLAVKLAALLPYAEAEELMAELAQINISDTTIWEQVQEVGAAAEAYLEQGAQQHSALPNLDEISAGITPSAVSLGVSMDGAKFNVRGEGWKEAKIGCVFTFAPTQPVSQTPGDTRRDIVQASDITYVIHFGSPEPFGQRVWAESDQRGWLAARQSVVLGDGAPWIWNLADLHFPTSTPVVDWYHAKQHLWEAAHLIYGITSPKAQTFVKRHEDHLYDGEVDRIARAILRAAHPASAPSTAAGLRRAAHYFMENQSRMQFAQFQRDKLPIGSGTVESGCKQFKDRFTKAGMRWSHDGAVNLMPLRAAALSKRFDTLWAAVCH